MLGIATGLMLGQPSVDRALDHIKDARQGLADEFLDLHNTGISVTSASYNNTTSVLNVTIENTGSNVLELEDVDLLLNGTYVTGSPGDIGYIYPGQDLKMSLTNITDPRSIKVIGPWGISDQTTSIARG